MYDFGEWLKVMLRFRSHKADSILKYGEGFYDILPKETRNMKEKYIEDELTSATFYIPCRRTGIQISVLLRRASPEAEKIK